MTSDTSTRVLLRGEPLFQFLYKWMLQIKIQYDQFAVIKVIVSNNISIWIKAARLIVIVKVYIHLYWQTPWTTVNFYITKPNTGGSITTFIDRSILNGWAIISLANTLIGIVTDQTKFVSCFRLNRHCAYQKRSSG
jgi:hypothetical protein